MQVDGGRMETYIQRCPEPCVLWWRRCLACYKTTALRYFHHQHHHRQRHQWTVSRRLWRHFCSLRLLNCTFHLMLCYLTLMLMHRMIGRVWLPCYGALEIIVTLLIIIIIMVSWGSAPSSEHSRLHSLTPIWVTLHTLWRDQRFGLKVQLNSAVMSVLVDLPGVANPLEDDWC